VNLLLKLKERFAYPLARDLMPFEVTFLYEELPALV